MASFIKPRLNEQVVNVATVPLRSPFRYPGGKTWLVPRIRKWLSSLPKRPCEFAEPFAGGAIVGLSVAFENLAERVTLVELDDQVAAVWTAILSGNAENLAAKIRSFYVSRESVLSALNSPANTALERAFVALLRNRVQRGGILAPGASLMKLGENGRGLRSRWYPETLSKRILDIARVKDQLSFLHGDGIRFMREKASREDIVFFVDPPYTVAAKRLYVHSEVDHEELFRVASTLRGDFLMTYDDAEPIRELARRFSFETKTIPMKNTHHEIMLELLVGRNLSWL